MQQSVEPFLQLCQPLAAPGGDANHRNAQALFQPGQVDGDMPLFRLVQEVDTEQALGQVSSTCMTSSSPRSRQVASQTTTAASGLAKQRKSRATASSALLARRE